MEKCCCCYCCCGLTLSLLLLLLLFATDFVALLFCFSIFVGAMFVFVFSFFWFCFFFFFPSPFHFPFIRWRCHVGGLATLPADVSQWNVSACLCLVPLFVSLLRSAIRFLEFVDTLFSFILYHIESAHSYSLYRRPLISAVDTLLER